MFFPADIVTMEGQCVKSQTGMDLTNAITLVLKDGMLCNLQSSAACVGDNIGVIAGTEGNLIIDNINNPQTITVNGPDRTYVETIHVPQQITGYEYQFLACRQALIDGLQEPREMPHEETLYIMQLMDNLRQNWDVRTDGVAVMANICAAIHEAMGFWWTGFYRVKNGELVLGPFQGPVACMHIGFGKGVCGTAWKEQRTIIVPDVEQFPGHIACSSLSRSEIVVPIFSQNGEVTGVLDIDSKELATFDDIDQQYLERICKMLTSLNL